MSTKGREMKKVLLALVIGVSMSSASYAVDTSKNTSFNKSDIQLLVDIIAERHNVPKDLAHAIVSLESNYDPTVTAVSYTHLTLPTKRIV